MCGIVGAYGAMSSDVFSKMLAVIGHRGPDHQAILSLEDIHLGHARLSIIDPSPSSNQPLWDRQRRACIVFNGEIYNYQTLREELQQLGYEFSSDGDAEVLLNLYIHFGIECLSKLEGMFAFAIWDHQSLFLARDPYGVKPLYYTENCEGFYFASEMKSLLLLSSLSRELNHDALFRTIVFLWNPGSTTVLKEIRKLEPGHYLLVNERQIVKDECFSTWPDYCPQKSSRVRACEKVETSLKASIKAQMVSDVPIGAFLSGGIDSSLIVAMVKSIQDTPIECFTINSRFNGKTDGETDDLPYAKMMAEHLQVPLNIVDLQPEMAKLLPKLLYHLDEPHGDPAIFNVFAICELARKKGIKVLFSGAGGDDIFSGYRRHQALLFERYWSFLPRFLRKYIVLVTKKLPKQHSLGRKIAKLFAYADATADERLLSYFYWIDPKIVQGLFTDDIQKKLSADPLHEIKSTITQQLQMPRLEKMLMLEKRHFLVDHNFNYTDKMSMAHGVEVRVPFLDSAILNTAAALDVRWKHRYGQGKWILKNMAKKYLPNEVIYRRKTGFGTPLRHWLKSDLKYLVDELLNDENINRRGIFKPQAVQELLSQDRSGKEDFSYPIFSLLCIELWCRLFVDT